ncbi:lipopolysaccharide biosynthesis protein [Cryobacterium sp. M91]|uniref:lipopolysaccharide biosynthesis protein n=1 Tax=Cryobacterium sp. M91 TaxID=2048294 RepID=UPI000CE47EAB|nr:oligosaccharide flippase family protein [Cryobacterium sp. M91]
MNRSALASQAAVSTVGVLVLGLSRFGYSVLIGRFMGPGDLAHVSAWLALALILSLLWPTGAGNAASHFLAHARSLGHTPVHSMRLILRTFWLSCVVMLAIGIPISILALGAELADVVVIAALIVSYSGYILARGIEVGLGRIERAAIWDVVAALATMTLLAVVLWAGLSWALLWPITIGYAIFGIQTWLRAQHGHEGLRQESIVEPTSILKLTSWNSLGLLASNGLIQFAMVYVFIVESPVKAGLFAAAMSLATPASMLSQAVTQVLIPRFSEWLATDPAGTRRRYVLVLAGMAAGLAAVFGAVTLASPLIVNVVFGSQYDGASTIMSMLLAGIFAFSIGLVATAYLLTSNRVVSATVFSITGLAVGLGTMIVVTPLWTGTIAASIGVTVGYTVTALGVVVVSLLPQRMPTLRATTYDPIG